MAEQYSSGLLRGGRSVSGTARGGHGDGYSHERRNLATQKFGEEIPHHHREFHSQTLRPLGHQRLHQAHIATPEHGGHPVSIPHDIVFATNSPSPHSRNCRACNRRTNGPASSWSSMTIGLACWREQQSVVTYERRAP